MHIHVTPLPPFRTLPMHQCSADISIVQDSFLFLKKEKKNYETDHE